MNEYYLSKGNHATADDGRCAMEWVAYIAGEPHTDQPVCVDQPLKSFCISFNDALDDEQRQKLRPYLARCIGTAGDGRTSERGYMCLDWLIRTHTPAWLGLAGLTDDATKLRALPEITNLETARQVGPIVSRARDRAYAARDAARAAEAAARAAARAAGVAAGAAAGVAAGAAAWAAAGDAAWAAARAAGAAAWVAAGAAAEAAARVAAWAAAEAAARDAAGVAARDAAGAAAGVAARDAVAPTVKDLQASAFDLLDRMLPKVMIDLPEPQVCRAREVCGVSS